jgi:hypothetical protein
MRRAAERDDQNNPVSPISEVLTQKGLLTDGQQTARVETEKTQEKTFRVLSVPA